MQTINQTLSNISVGNTITHQNLTMFALLNGGGVEADYITLDEAMAAGTVQVTEVSEGGSVPELQFVNGGDKAVLLLDGEELVGAKQNRALNLTILVPPKSTIVIPVSCVEQGRWGYRGRDFKASDKAQFAEGRARKAASVSFAMGAGRGRMSDQGDVWDSISEKMSRMEVRSETMAMEDTYESVRPRLNEFIGAFSAQDGQVGALFTINGEISGLDLFDSSDTIRKLMPKLVGSYAMDALDRFNPVTEAPRDGVAQEFLKVVAAAQVSAHPAVGMGTDLRFQSQFVAGGALEAEERIVHLCAFPTMRAQSRPDIYMSEMARSSRRRRNRAG